MAELLIVQRHSAIARWGTIGQFHHTSMSVELCFLIFVCRSPRTKCWNGRERHSHVIQLNRFSDDKAFGSNRVHDSLFHEPIGMIQFTWRDELLSDLSTSKHLQTKSVVFYISHTVGFCIFLCICRAVYFVDPLHVQYLKLSGRKVTLYSGQDKLIKSRADFEHCFALSSVDRAVNMLTSLSSEAS